MICGWGVVLLIPFVGASIWVADKTASGWFRDGPGKTVGWHNSTIPVKGNQFAENEPINWKK